MSGNAEDSRMYCHRLGKRTKRYLFERWIGYVIDAVCFLIAVFTFGKYLPDWGTNWQFAAFDREFKRHWNL